MIPSTSAVLPPDFPLLSAPTGITRPLSLWTDHHTLLRLSPPRPEKTSETLTLAILLVKPLLLLLPLLVLDVGDETVDSLP